MSNQKTRTIIQTSAGPACSVCGRGVGHWLAADESPCQCAVSGTEERVCADIENRQRLGIRKYGRSVADNPIGLKGWLQHAYEECLDQAVYLKRAIEEIEKTETN